MNERQVEPAEDASKVIGTGRESGWRSEAVLRLGVSIFISIYAGSVVMSAVHYAQANRSTKLWFFLLAGASLACLCAAIVLMRRPTKDLGLDQLLRWLIPLAGGFFIGSTLGLWAQKVAGPSAPSISQMLISVVSFQAAALVLIGRFVKEHQLSWNEAFGFSNHWGIAILFGVVFACIFLPIGFGLQSFSFELLKHIGKTEEQQAVQTLRMSASWPQRALLGILTVVVVPPAEEGLFRGVLYPWIKKLGFPRLAFLGTSLAFALIHLHPITFLPLFVLALILTGLYEKTNNLLAPIVAHASFNAVNLVLLYVTEFSKPR